MQIASYDVSFKTPELFTTVNLPSGEVAKASAMIAMSLDENNQITIGMEFWVDGLCVAQMEEPTDVGLHSSGAVLGEIFSSPTAAERTVYDLLAYFADTHQTNKIIRTSDTTIEITCKKVVFVLEK